MPALLRKPRIAAAGLALGLFCHAAAAQPDPNKLWEIVHRQCVPERQQHRALTPPCVAVNLHGRYTIIKDRNGATQFLLIPTARVTGIESPAVLAPDAPDYFAAAWRARGLVANALGHAMPDDTLSLAVNSQLSRSQNQLHIHIDCVRADVRRALQSETGKIGARWAPLDVWLLGHHYSAMRVTGPTLARHNPFKLLARGIPGARAEMGHHTLVVVGMRFAGGEPGFILLDDHADLAHGDNAGGEELQDHSCALGSLGHG